MGRWANREGISAIADNAPKKRALHSVRSSLGTAEQCTHKNKTPPREKKPEVASGNFKKTDPMIMAWKIWALNDKVVSERHMIDIVSKCTIAVPPARTSRP